VSAARRAVEEVESPEAASSGGWNFEPDGARASRLAADIDDRLIGSIRYLEGEIGSEIGWDAEKLERWTATLAQAQRIDCLVHVLFHSLVEAVQADDFASAGRIAQRLLKSGSAPPQLTILPLEADPDGPRALSLFGRFVDLEEDNRLDLIVPDPAALGPSILLIEEALDLIRRNDPDLDRELRAFVTDILLFHQGPDHLLVSAAASCFQNWGGLLVNPSVQRDALDMVELLAHESTHLLLFALALDEPLLTNPASERHFSPLRDAPRTMDGVYHATIVCARVMRALLRQAAAPDADAGFREAALDRAKRSRVLFDESVAIVETAASLTPLGRAVLDGTRKAADALRPALLET